MIVAVLAGCYLLLGIGFALASRGMSLDEGTESLRSGTPGGVTETS